MVLHPRSNATVNRYFALIRAMFYKAADWGRFDGVNPVRKVKFNREYREIHPLSQDDITKILDAARKVAANPQSPLQVVICDMIIFALNTGLRKSEMLNLKWSSVHGDEITVIGKGKKVRTVPPNSAALKIPAKSSRLSEYVFIVPNRGNKDL